MNVSTQSCAPALTLPERVTVVNAAEVLAGLSAALRRQPAAAAALDAEPLQRFDSSALSLILSLQRQAAAAGQSALPVHNLAPHLVELARLYGVSDLMQA